jgi:UDP-GlcNAc:undecaprenyl-phosphate/decaprenyl-phosphate GlcNAc-1-phosphate transferase
MAQNYISGLMAMGVCSCTLPGFIAAARRWYLYDLPGPLKVHKEKVPRIGGAAMMAGLVAGAALLGPSGLRAYALPLLAFLLVWTIGLVDDLKSLPSLFRFGVHLVGGSLFWLGGWRLTCTGIPAADFVATCLLVAFVVNAMNLFDGLDGLAGGTAAIVSLGFIPLLAGADRNFPASLAWGLLGVCLGFLMLNFPPARVFMGDSGSTLLGITFAFLMLECARAQRNPLGIAPGLIFLGLPLADALSAILRRSRALGSPFEGDRRHFYDLLTRRGWSVHRVLAWSFGTTGVLMLAGWACVWTPSAAPYVALLVTASLAYGAHRIGSLRPEAEPIVARTEAV